MGVLFRVLCRLGWCMRCATYDTSEGIGGRCIDCGKVHGWVTREELRAWADADLELRFYDR